MCKPEIRLEDLPRIEIDWSGHRISINMTTEEVVTQEAKHQHARPTKDEDDERRRIFFRNT